MSERDSGEDVSRRGVIKGIAATAALLGVGYKVEQHFTHDDKPDDSGDVLVDKEKFQAFVDKFEPLATKLAEDGAQPIPYEVFLAVAMHESDSGTSELAVNATNYFGVVAKDGWQGDVYPKLTEEEVLTTDVSKLSTEHPELVVLLDFSDGKSRVKYERDFRKYGNAEDSFKDFADKLYFKLDDGSYRYADVVDYLEGGGRDPHEVVRLMSDYDQPGEARWATGREWHEGVDNYISTIQSITGNASGDAKPDTEPSLPETESGINLDEIDFSELDQPRDETLIETIKNGFRAASLEKYKEFDKSGIKSKYSDMRALIGNNEYFDSVYRADIDPKYFVIHLWANGVTFDDLKDPNKIPAGSSHKSKLSDQVQSWYNVGKKASCGYLLSDNDSGDLWRLTRGEFGASNHVGHGIQDEGAETHPDVGNSNAVGIEVQANTIYDVTSKQFEMLVYWCTKMLLDSGIVQEGMLREDVDKIIDDTVIGHGKAEGLEFGYKYTRPLIAAIQQFVYIAVQG